MEQELALAFRLEDLQLNQFNQTLTISLDNKTFQCISRLQREALAKVRDPAPVSSGPDFTQEQIEYLHRCGLG